MLYCRQCIAPAKERTTPSLQEADLIGSRSVSNTQEVKPAKASVQSESEKRAMLPPRKLPPRIGSSRPAQSSVASNNQTIPGVIAIVFSTVSVAKLTFCLISATGASWTTYSVSNPPPVTVTGVAPWAKKPLTADTGEQNAAIISSSKSQTEQNLISKSTTENSVTSKIDSYDAIKKYMILCNPSKSDRKSDKDRERNEGKDDDDDWNTKQAAPTPTILPTLRFHDLVFGQVLGEGAFSTVKYARHITRDKPQQEWPEFAVKIISSSKISEHSYYFSTVREIALLKVLSHPGIARLISAFRYRDSAYLVLEYASRGDLHSFLVQHGRISHLCTR